jgi:hypothetical protein
VDVCFTRSTTEVLTFARRRRAPRVENSESKETEKQPVDPVRAELARIVRDHVWYYIRQRDQVDAIAKRVGCTPEEALVYIIVEEILDGFDLKPKG